MAVTILNLVDGGGGKRSRLLENGYELTLKYIKNMFQ